MKASSIRRVTPSNANGGTPEMRTATNRPANTNAPPEHTGSVRQKALSRNMRVHTENTRQLGHSSQMVDTTQADTTIQTADTFNNPHICHRREATASAPRADTSIQTADTSTTPTASEIPGT